MKYSRWSLAVTATAFGCMFALGHRSAQADAPGKGAATKIPFVIYADDVDPPPYVWSGWEGDTASIGMNEKCTTSPHTGKTCMKCEFKATTGWGGICWQSPANDWGDQPGGYDISGAKKLTFWAKGDTGSEVVSFAMGVLGKDKKYYDTASGNLKDQKLTTDWKQYTIDLAGQDLTQIKTGFVWTTASKGQPVTFYLDDIQYE